jgi:hypothetical protein
MSSSTQGNSGAPPGHSDAIDPDDNDNGNIAIILDSDQSAGDNDDDDNDGREASEKANALQKM